MPDLPGSIASLNSNILCNLVTDLRFGCLLGTGSFGKCVCSALALSIELAALVVRATKLWLQV